jgi:hypothetical protein
MAANQLEAREPVHHLPVSVLCFMLLLGVPCHAQEAPVPDGKGTVDKVGKFQPAVASGPVAPDADPSARLAALGMKLEGGKLRVGLVEVDPKTRIVALPAKVHASSGQVEYLLVHSAGKIHETILITEALPGDIHLACLLAGYTSAKGKPPTQVVVEATWETNGPARVEPIENLVAFARGHPGAAEGKVPEPGAWTYQGSIMDAGGFAAAREGSIIALINDPAALITNPRPGRDDDTLHVPNAAKLPSSGVPIKITLRPEAPVANPSVPRDSP